MQPHLCEIDLRSLHLTLELDRGILRALRLGTGISSALIPLQVEYNAGTPIYPPSKVYLDHHDILIFQYCDVSSPSSSPFISPANLALRHSPLPFYGIWMTIFCMTF